MKSQRNRRRAGATVIEFTLVCIPLIFVTISLFELTRGLWTYQNMAYAVREGVRYAAMHGRGCTAPNNCTVTVGQITRQIQGAGPGFDSAALTITFTSAKGSTTGTMSGLATSNTVWPPAGANAPGQTVQVSMVYAYRTFLAVFWSRSSDAPASPGTYNLMASSSQAVQF